MPVEILIDENATIDAIVSVPSVRVEIIANVIREDDTIIMDGVHVERLGGGQLDRQNARLLCAEICRHYGVSRVVVRGARRTTGRAAGKILGRSYTRFRNDVKGAILGLVAGHEESRAHQADSGSRWHAAKRSP